MTVAVVLHTNEPNLAFIEAAFEVVPSLGQRVVFQTKYGTAAGTVSEVEHRQDDDGTFKFHVTLD